MSATTDILKLSRKWRSKEEIIKEVQKRSNLSSETIGRKIRQLVEFDIYQAKPKKGKSWNVYRKL